MPKIKLSFEIEVQEECTPSFLANRIMGAACYSYALKEGESICCLESNKKINADDYRKDIKKLWESLK